MGYQLDDILELIGLERKSSLLGAVLPAIGLLAVGAAVGAGIGLAFAPASGRRFRQEVSDKFDQIRDRMKTEMEQKQAPPAVHANSHQA
jgi:gas vesicle protein